MPLADDWSRGNLQTLEHYTEPVGGPAPKRPRMLPGVVLAVVLLGLSVLAIQTRLGVAGLLGIAFVVGVALFAIRRQVVLIEAVAFLIHFDGIGVSELTLGRALSGVVLVVIAYKLVVEKWRPPALPTRHWIGPLALTTWAVASGLWSERIGSWMIGLGTIGLAIGYFAATGLLVDSYDKVKAFMRAYWYGGLFGAGAGIVGLVIGARSFGFNADANLFGVLAASMIPLTIYYRRNATTPRARFVYGVIVLMVLGGAAGAGSRSGVIGAALALFGSLVYRPGESLGRRIGSVIPATLVTMLVAVILLVANPNTLERGTSSSGRTDFWRVTIELIAERPVLGHGQRQINEKIPDLLATTPGTTVQSDSRDEVTSHNTWLDFLGNLGFVGFSMYAGIIVVTAVSFLRPHWRQTRELSGYLFVMMLPVLSGSMFLDLSNNKLAWALIGLAGILQVPSWGRRYRGYFSAPQQESVPDRFSEAKLARWDLKVSQRFRTWVVLGAVIGAFVFGVPAASGAVVYEASVSIVVPKLDNPPNLPFVRVDRARVSVIHTLVLSDAYAAELIARSGVDASVPEMRGDISVDRPKYGAYVEITFSSTDEQLVDAVAPHLLDSLEALTEAGRDFTIPTLRDEVRPTVPGEQRYYTGPMYIPVSEYVDRGAVPPRSSVNLLVGALTGALVAIGYVLLQQRRPRVNDDDSFPEAVGLPFWSHIGRAGRRRRNGATADQYAHVAVRATEGFGGDRMPRGILVAGPTRSSSTRALALGCAGALAAIGHRVVLVDAQVKRPWLSRRLGFFRAPGVRDVGSGAVPIERVLRRVKPLFLPRALRRATRHSRENLRFVSAGRVWSKGPEEFDPTWLDALGEGIVTVVLAPPLTGTVAVGPVLGWADVVMYDLVEGETVTFDAEDGALQVATFARGSAGVILSDV